MLGLTADCLGDGKKARNKGLSLASGGGGRAGEFVLTPKLPSVTFYYGPPSPPSDGLALGHSDTGRWREILPSASQGGTPRP